MNQPTPVIARSEATRQSRSHELSKNWIASSQGLLAMTAEAESNHLNDEIF